MLIETIAILSTVSMAWKATDINEQTLNTLQKAHTTYAEAVALFEQHKLAADASLVKLINRKKAIISTRMNRFLSIYQQIQAIDFRPGEGIIELYTQKLSVQQVEEIQEMAISSIKPMSEQELVVKYLFTGIGGAMLADSKRNAEIANSQKRIANVHYAQAKTLAVAVDAIGQRAEQLASLLARFSVLFGQCIDSTAQIIERNGVDRARYSKSDRETLMNCLNLASAIKAVLDVPVLNADGSVTESSLRAFEEGENRFQALQRQI